MGDEMFDFWKFKCRVKLCIYNYVHCNKRYGLRGSEPASINILLNSIKLRSGGMGVETRGWLRGKETGVYIGAQLAREKQRWIPQCPLPHYLKVLEINLKLNFKQINIFYSRI